MNNRTTQLTTEHYNWQQNNTINNRKTQLKTKNN